MNYQTIILEKKDYIATITLNRPERLNALNDQMIDELSNVCTALDKDDKTRVVVITGAGRAFCAGADLRDEYEGKSKMGGKRGPRLFTSVNNLGKPVIASINGVAVGGGCTITLSCDIRIASEDAKFQLPFTRLSASTELGSTYLLPRLVGMGKACELIFTAKMILVTLKYL